MARLAISFVLWAAFLAGGLSAQATWTGATSTDWYTASNWSTAAVPTSVTDVTIPVTANAPRIEGTTTNAQCRNLTINAGATLTHNANVGTLYFYTYGTVTINGTLTSTSTGSYYAYLYMAGTGAVQINGAINITGAYYRYWYCYGPISVSGSITLSASYYTYVYHYADSMTINAGGSINSSTMTSYMYWRHYGNSTTDSPVFTNNGTMTIANATYSIYQFFYLYGDFVNNGTFTGNYTSIYMYWDTTYGKQNAVLSSSSALTLNRLYCYKYQSTTVFGSLTVNANVDVIYTSTSACVYHYGGTLNIGSGFTLSCYSYYIATSSYSPTLGFLSATSTLACRYYFYGYYLILNTSQGIIRVGSTSYATAYCYMYSANINPTGGTFQFVESSSVIAYVSSSYVGSGAPRFHNVSVGNGTNATTLNMSFSGVCTHRIAGTLTVNANGTFNHSGSGASYPIEFAGNIVNNGTISSSNAANPFVFTGNTTLSGSGALTFPNITINSGATLTSSSGNITVNGNFTNNGTFIHNLGTVTFATATASTLAGNTTFRNLTCTTTGKTLYFAAGSTTTVNGVLTLTGATGSRVTLRSTSAGSVWYLNDAGTENVSAVDVQDSTATNSINAQGDSLNSGNNTNWIFPDRLTVAATAGTAQQVYANATGSGGNGISIGTFTLTATQGAPTLSSISIRALGNADDATAYSGVALYEDTGGTTGAFDPGTDTPYATEVSNFGVDDGTVQFSQNLAFSTSQTRRFFVVVKLNGPTLATPGQTLNTRVETCTVTGIGFIQGAPSTTMNGLTIQAPAFTFADASAASAVTAYPASGDYVLQEFTVNYAAGPNNTLASVTLGAQGSGNDATAYTSVRLYADTNTSGNYDVGVDTLLNSQSAFAANDGGLTFTISEAFAAGVSSTYFVVVAFNGSPTTGHTFQCRVTGATYGYSGTTTTGTPAPAGFTAGLSITQPAYNITDNSPATQGMAYLGGSGYLLQSFTIAYPSGPTNTLTGIELTSGGGGNDQADYSSVELYRDANANGSYDSGVDVLVASQPSFPSNNGALTFTLSGAESQFPAAASRRYFVIVSFNLVGASGTTFVSQLTDIVGTSFGATLSGVPSPSGGPCPGLLLRGNNLVATFNGPGTASTIGSADQGAGNNGLVLLDVTLTTLNLGWTINTLTFVADGGGNDAAAFNYIALFEDANLNGTYDGATGGDSMAVAAAGTAFSGDNGSYVATLANTAIGNAASRRFFLVVKMAGTAVTGHTFNAQLQTIAGVAPAGGSLSGLPTSFSTAFIVGASALTITLGPASPTAATVEGGVAFAYTMAQFRFTATNNNCTINSMILTNSGSGSWVTHLQTPGVEIYQDDGNGIYDGSPTDTLVFSGNGNVPTLNCTFTTPVTVPNAQSRDLWVRVLFAANAGTSIPETYRTAVAAAGDVNATGATSILGTPAPTSALCSVVLFNVASMTPSYDIMSGGANIVLSGSGFLAPLTLTINGVLCPGTPVINVNGTQVTGLKVPAGSGSNLTVVLNNGALGAKTLTQTFSYTTGSTIGSGGGAGGGGGGGGCSTDAESGALWLLALALVSVAGALAARRGTA